jgi:hypothetical protein
MFIFSPLPLYHREKSAWCPLNTTPVGPQALPRRKKPLAPAANRKTMPWLSRL